MNLPVSAKNADFTILVLDDDAVDRKIVTRAMRAAKLEATVVECATADDAFFALEAHPIDVLIVDYFLPGLTGIEVIEEMRQKRPFLPVVVLTGQGDEELASKIMKIDGADYLSKASLQPGRLIQSIRYVYQYGREKLRDQETKIELENHARELSALLEEARAASDTRDEVLAIVSHDLRNPLNTVSMAISMLRDSLSPSTDVAMCSALTDRMERAVLRMNRLIDDLLDASRIESMTLVVEPKPVRAVELLEVGLESGAVTAASKGVKLERGRVDGAIEVLADRDRVGQVFANLVGNAVKFTPEGGVANVSVETREPEWVKFSVRDSGPGIPPQNLPHVFDRFWKEKSASRDGAGLGLYIAHGIVSAHGGQMSVESNVGQGSVFSFRLPRALD